MSANIHKFDMREVSEWIRYVWIYLYEWFFFVNICTVCYEDCDRMLAYILVYLATATLPRWNAP